MPAFVASSSKGIRIPGRDFLQFSPQSAFPSFPAGAQYTRITTSKPSRLSPTHFAFDLDILSIANVTVTTSG